MSKIEDEINRKKIVSLLLMLAVLSGCYVFLELVETNRELRVSEGKLMRAESWLIKECSAAERLINDKCSDTWMGLAKEQHWMYEDELTERDKKIYELVFDVSGLSSEMNYKNNVIKDCEVKLDDCLTNNKILHKLIDLEENN